MLSPDLLTSSPNERAAISEINSIYTWVEEQKTSAASNDKALGLIKDFETWYGSLEQKFDEEYRLLFQYLGVADVNEAKRRRYAIAQALGLPIPSDWGAPPGIPPPPENPLREAETVIITVAALFAVGAFFMSRSRT